MNENGMKRLRAIKGFDANFRCRDYQFEVGQTYSHEGVVKACKSGFHAIPEDQHPLAVFGYYPPAGSRFAIVEVLGATETDGDKIAAQIIEVQREIGIGELAQEAVDWVMARAKHEGPIAVNDNGLATASGTRGAATASGYGGKVKGVEGNALFALERHTWDGPIISVACGIVGKNGIQADVWYRCVGGELVPHA